MRLTKVHPGYEGESGDGLSGEGMRQPLSQSTVLGRAEPGVVEAQAPASQGPGQSRLG